MTLQDADVSAIFYAESHKHLIRNGLLAKAHGFWSGGAGPPNLSAVGLLYLANEPKGARNLVGREALGEVGRQRAGV